MMGPDSVKWHGAMKSKIVSIYEFKLMNLVYLSGRIKSFRLEWIYKQIDMNRLVGKNVYGKVQGVDYGKIEIFHSDN